MNYGFIDEILAEHYANKDNEPDYYKRLKEQQALLGEKHSQSEFRNDVVDEESLLTLLGRKWRKNLELLISFVDEYKHIFGRKELYELPLASTNKNLLNIYDTHQNVSNLLELAQRVDLLKCVDETYRFNADEDLNSCKKYICNKHVQDLIISLANKHGIVIRRFMNAKRPKKKIYTDESFPTRIAINSKLNLRVPSTTDDEVIQWLDQKYPQIVYYQQLADDLNKRFYKEDRERRIQFVPTIRRSRGNSSTITKIGIRATNPLVSLKAHDNGCDSDKVWRKDWLNEHYQNGWIEFDVKSSIFRVNYFLNKGIWLDHTVDFYELMYGRTFDSKAKRDEYKAIAMSLYFERTIGTLSSHLCAKAESLRRYDTLILKLVLGDMQRKMFDVIGRGYDSEIFLHESCIYMELQKALLERGFDVTVVYDGFYVEKQPRIDMEWLVPDV